jgi:hypothetical protein
MRPKKNDIILCPCFPDHTLGSFALLGLFSLVPVLYNKFGKSDNHRAVAVP